MPTACHEKLFDNNFNITFTNFFEEIDVFEAFRNQTHVPSQAQVTQLVQELKTWEHNFTTFIQQIESVFKRTTDLFCQLTLVVYWSWMSGGEKSSKWAIEEINLHQGKLFPIEVYPSNQFEFLDTPEMSKINNEMTRVAIDLMSQGHRPLIETHLRDLVQRNQVLANKIDHILNSTLNVTKVENKKLSLSYYLSAMMSIDTARKRATLANQWLVSQGTSLVGNDVWFNLIPILFLLVFDCLN